MVEEGESGRDEERATMTSGSRLEVEMHPLENPCFIRSVFEYLKVADLKNLRLIGNPLWFEESLKTWKEKVTIRISGNPEMDLDFGRRSVSVRELQEIFNAEEENMLRLHSRPFQNYILSFFENCGEEHADYSWVIDKFATHMKSLTLDACSFENVSVMMNLVFRKLPNLETLRLKGNIRFSNGPQPIDMSLYDIHPKIKCVEVTTTSKLFGSGPTMWQEFLEKMRYIEELQITSGSEKTAAADVWTVMNAVNAIRIRDPSTMNLKILKIRQIPLNQQGIHIGHLNIPFPLERLIGSVHNQNFGVMEPFQYLRLRVLRQMPASIGNFANERFEVGIFYRFQQLRELQILGRVPAIFNNLGQYDAPQLERLRFENPYLFPLERPRAIENFHRPIRNVVFSGLREFECIHLFCMFSKKEIERLSHAMPNLKRLVMPITRKAFPEVCKQWPNIHSITVVETKIINQKGMFLNDRAITGIAKGKIERAPNITDLKYLLELRIPCERDAHARFTDRAVNDGFLMIPSLHILTARFKKLSDEAKIALEQKLKIADIRVKAPVVKEEGSLQSPNHDYDSGDGSDLEEVDGAEPALPTHDGLKLEGGEGNP